MMERVYANLVRIGAKTIDQVPERLRAKVVAILDPESLGR